MAGGPDVDLRYGIRALRRTPAFTIVAVLTLALGMGAITAIFVVVNGVLLKPLPYGNPAQLVGAWHDMAPLNITHAQQTQGTYYTYQRLAHTIDAIGVYQANAVNVAEPGGKGEPRRVTSASISGTLIPLLQIPQLRGRDFTTAEDLPNGPAAVIISEAMWRGQFGADPDILQRTLEVSGRTRQIVGVMPARFRFPTATTELWLPLGLDPASPNTGGFNYNSIARLKPGVAVEEATRDFATVLKRMPELFPLVVPGDHDADAARPGEDRAGLIPLKDDVDRRDCANALDRGRRVRRLVLLVACANVDEPHPRSRRWPSARNLRARGARGRARARHDAFLSLNPPCCQASAQRWGSRSRGSRFARW